MESFLNLLWVAIALSAFGVWRVYWVRQHRDGLRQPFLEWTAFACALVLLFFVVSLTDDLHSELVIFDECSTSRRQTSLCTGPHHGQNDATGPNAPFAAILPQLALNSALQEISLLAAVPRSGPVFLEGDLASGRSPPASSL